MGNSDGEPGYKIFINSDMSRLLAFGCSNTQGVGLPDLANGEWKNRHTSKYSWCEVLAQELNLSCVNLGFGGTSNLQIMQSVIDADIKKDDILVIMWTELSRHTIFYPDSGPTTLISSMINNPPDDSDVEEQAIQYYSKIYTDETKAIELLQFINHVNLIAKDAGAYCFHFDAWYTQQVEHIIKHLEIVMNMRYNISASYTEWKQYPLAPDGHPGVDANKAFGTRVSEIIKSAINDK